MNFQVKFRGIYATQEVYIYSTQKSIGAQVTWGQGCVNFYIYTLYNKET